MKPHYLGHRKRVKQKFLTSLGQDLQDYELLEILMFSANARCDTKILAKNLLQKFGDLSAIINADFDALKQIAGVGESSVIQIKIIAEIMKRVMKHKASQQTVLNNWQSLLDYSRMALAHLKYEQFRVLFLDKKFRLLADEIVEIGKVDSVRIDIKEIVKKTLLLHASSVVLLHNHPSGEAQPSSLDIKTTQEIKSVLQPLSIKLIDHLIIAVGGHFSFKENGLI